MSLQSHVDQYNALDQQGFTLVDEQGYVDHDQVEAVTSTVDITNQEVLLAISAHQMDNAVTTYLGDTNLTIDNIEVGETSPGSAGEADPNTDAINITLSTGAMVDYVLAGDLDATEDLVVHELGHRHFEKARKATDVELGVTATEGLNTSWSQMKRGKAVAAARVYREEIRTTMSMTSQNEFTFSETLAAYDSLNVDKVDDAVNGDMEDGIIEKDPGKVSPASNGNGPAITSGNQNSFTVTL